MAVYVKEGRATEVEFYPPERGASATVRVVDPSGVELSTPTPTLDDFGVNIASVASTTEFGIPSGAWPIPGRSYWMVRDDGPESFVRVAEVDDLGEPTIAVVLEGPAALSGLFVGQYICGARFTVTVPAITTRGLFHRIEWTVTGADGVVRGPYVQTLHVCKSMFRTPVLADEVARYIALTFPDVGVGRPFGYFAERARRASLRVERELLKRERFQDRIGDFDIFVEAGVVAIKLELADEGLIPPDAGDPNTYKRDLRTEFEEAIAAALAGTWYDANDDDVVDEITEVQGGMYNIPWVRR